MLEISLRAQVKYQQAKDDIFELKRYVNLSHANYTRKRLLTIGIVNHNIIAVVYDVRLFYLAVIKRKLPSCHVYVIMKGCHLPLIYKQQKDQNIWLDTARQPNNTAQRPNNSK